ncbi:expressed unknown protein [Seminavis robusta]|uniref:Uncharacterized protein n=1 Tax=Seminavis robusta TaxID=568900 RepID=A0A9N8E6B6_9STRA|nr:expressed unknown protein [Seminavis robusta]|eukprot:Sro595_g172720.1 n/a (490) ;mRNA; f:54557-56026
MMMTRNSRMAPRESQEALSRPMCNVDRILLCCVLLVFVLSHTLELKGIMVPVLGGSDPATVQQQLAAPGMPATVNQITQEIRATTTVTSQLPPTKDDKPSCRSLMKGPNSPYRDGAFLTRRSLPVAWIPRVDGSRELQHSMCTLHRYTADEARHCLANHHLNFIGDSLTRYQFVSLVHLIHKGKYPPRWGLPFPGERCKHQDERGVGTCSPPGDANVNKEQDWQTVTPEGADEWMHFMRALGTFVFDGYMEAAGVRIKDFPFEKIAENYIYVAPAIYSTANKTRPILSYQQELGWANNPTPIHGFHYTGCAFKGMCQFTSAMARERLIRANRNEFDFEQDFIEAIGPNGVLRRELPPVDIAIYNRGYWGALEKERAEKIMPNLHSFSQGENGRCFFKTSTGGHDWVLEPERTHVQDATWSNGCGFLDFAHLTADFNTIYWQNKLPPRQMDGHVNDERDTIFWDPVHLQPWVNEELNNMLLNVLCNAHMP